MGTYYTPGNTMQDTVRACIEEVQPKAHVLVGQCLWMIATIPAGADSEIAGKDLIVLDLITDCGTGFKPMDETVGPFYHSCPLSWLDRVPDPRLGYSTKWRAAVRAWHAGRPLPAADDLDIVRPDQAHA